PRRRPAVIQIVHRGLPAGGRLLAGPLPSPPYAASAAALRDGGVTTAAGAAGGGRLAGPLPSPPYAASAAALRDAGVTTVACLLDRNELPPALEEAFAECSLRLLHFPVPDMGVPRD